jgi:hypothetical protein
MGKQHAIQGAQEALAGIGVSGTVTDVQRHGREAIIVLSDGKAIRVSGLLAIKLLKMLSKRYLSPWAPRK